MECSGSGEVFLANQAMLVHVVTLRNDSLTVSGANILAFETGIDWDVTRVKGGATGMLAGGLFNIHLKGAGLVALVSDGEPMRLDVAEAPTFVDPQAAIAWSGGVSTSLKTDIQAKSFIGMGSGESIQLAMSGQGWVLVQPSEGRHDREFVVTERAGSPRVCAARGRERGQSSFIASSATVSASRSDSSSPSPISIP